MIDKIVRYLKWTTLIHIHIVKGFSPPHGVNYIFIASPVYFVCVCVLRTFKFCSLSKFQLHNPVLSTIITMFYIRSSDLIFLIIENLYPFTNLLYLPPPSDRSEGIDRQSGNWA